MKRLIFCVCLLMVFTLVGCQKAGDVKNAKVDLGESKVYSEEDREKAVECVKEKFKEFKNCEMKKIWYDESTDYAGAVAKEGTNSIVLYASFKTGNVDVQSGFSDNSDEEFSWTLERDDKDGEWKVVNYGVG